MQKKRFDFQKKNNDSQKKVESYYYIARALISFGQYEESAVYLEKAFQEPALKNDDLLKAVLLNLQATFYSRISLEESSYQNNLKALELIKSNKDLESRLFVANLYTKIADYFAEMNDLKKAQEWSTKSIQLIEKIPDKEYLSVKRIYKNKPFIYFYKSRFYLLEKNQKKLFHLLKKDMSKLYVKIINI